MNRGKSDFPRLINRLASRGSLKAPTLSEGKATKERILRNATPTFAIALLEEIICVIIDSLLYVARE